MPPKRQNKERQDKESIGEGKIRKFYTRCQHLSINVSSDEPIEKGKMNKVAIGVEHEGEISYDHDHEEEPSFNEEARLRAVDQKLAAMRKEGGLNVQKAVQWESEGRDLLTGAGIWRAANQEEYRVLVAEIQRAEDPTVVDQHRDDRREERYEGSRDKLWGREDEVRRRADQLKAVAEAAQTPGLGSAQDSSMAKALRALDGQPVLADARGFGSHDKVGVTGPHDQHQGGSASAMKQANRQTMQAASPGQIRDAKMALQGRACIDSGMKKQSKDQVRSRQQRMAWREQEAERAAGKERDISAAAQPKPAPSGHGSAAPTLLDRELQQILSNLTAGVRLPPAPASRIATPYRPPDSKRSYRPLDSKRSR